MKRGHERVGVNRAGVDDLLAQLRGAQTRANAGQVGADIAEGVGGQAGGGKFVAGVAIALGEIERDGRAACGVAGLRGQRLLHRRGGLSRGRGREQPAISARAQPNISAVMFAYHDLAKSASSRAARPML